MGNIIGSNNEFPSLLVKEGTAPSSPAAGDQRVYIDSADHHLKRKNSGGTVKDLEAGATSPLTTKGDLWTYASADAREAVGSNGQELIADSAQTNGIKWVDRTGAIEFQVDGGGSALTTGSKGFVEVPYACTIVAARLFADQTGSITMSVKKSTYSGFPTTSSIVASAKPTLSSAQKSEDTTLTGWTTTLAAGDVLEFTIDSIATITRITLSLSVKKTA